MTTGKIEAFNCTRCKHQWYPRKFDERGQPVRPVKCPSCKSPYWAKPRMTKADRAELVAKKTRAYWRDQRKAEK